MIDFRKAVGQGKRIVLCEADPRVLRAARSLKDGGLIEPLLVGEADELRRVASENGLSLDGINIIGIEPEKYKDKYYELRKHKNITAEDALRTLRDPAFFSCMLMDDGQADGMVCGASWPTANTLRPALQILADGLVSSWFLMRTAKGEFLFADCALNVQPDAEQLSQIAVNTGLVAEDLGLAVRLAMLSHSSEGSAHNPDQEKVMKATDAVKRYVTNNAKAWKVGGELQVDAAMVEDIGKSKAPHSEVQGDANVFVFPDVDAGNIGYKLVQRFSDAQAIGPILTNLKKPVNDLSRGCTAEEIVEVAYITAWQSR